MIVFAWGYFIYTGSVSTIWPMFGTANQLLATIALAVGTSYIINNGKAKYAWVTIAPMAFVGITTLTAGWKNIFGLYLPQISICQNPGSGNHQPPAHFNHNDMCLGDFRQCNSEMVESWRTIPQVLK